MEIIVDEHNKRDVLTKIDPTRFKVVRHYLELPIEEYDNPEEAIQYVAVIQDGYNLAEVVSPFIENIKEDRESIIAGEHQAEYLFQLLENNVIRFVFPNLEGISPNVIDYVDLPDAFDQEETFEVFMAPPIYWIKSLKKV